MMTKRILITGKNSYIGDSIQNWIMNKPDFQYIIEQLDVQSDEWKNFDYSGYDGIVHVAGIVHRKDITDPSIYKKVNTDLPYEIAKLAKSQGVKQFVFLSTMAVYGIGKRLNENIIDADTDIQPLGLYAKSKYDAECLLKTLNDNDFKVGVIRPPNVYGKGCRGGYIAGFTKIVRMLPAIPMAYGNVRQSVLYIDNLCEFIYFVIERGEQGLFMPQDEAIPSAVELMEAIAFGINKNIRKSKILGRVARLFSFVSIVKKAYGGIAYSIQLSDYFGNQYRVVEFKEAIRRTVKK